MLYLFQLRAWEEQQANWVSEKAELQQRVEEEEEKAEKLEKYVGKNSVFCMFFLLILCQRLVIKSCDYRRRKL